MILPKARAARAYVYRTLLEHGTQVRSTALFILGRSHGVNDPPPSGAIDPQIATVDLPRAFHRRMAVIIDAVQVGIWEAGVRDLLGYATDYAFGQQRGMQTLVLKSKHRSAYVRLSWNTIMDDTAASRQLVDEAIRTAINELR